MEIGIYIPVRGGLARVWQHCTLVEGVEISNNALEIRFCQNAHYRLCDEDEYNLKPEDGSNNYKFSIHYHFHQEGNC